MRWEKISLIHFRPNCPLDAARRKGIEINLGHTLMPDDKLIAEAHDRAINTIAEQIQKDYGIAATKKEEGQ